MYQIGLFLCPFTPFVAIVFYFTIEVYINPYTNPVTNYLASPSFTFSATLVTLLLLIIQVSFSLSPHKMAKYPKGALSSTFQIARTLEAICLICIIGMTANFVAQMVSSKATPPNVIISTISMVCQVFSDLPGFTHRHDRRG